MQIWVKKSGEMSIRYYSSHTLITPTMQIDHWVQNEPWACKPASEFAFPKGWKPSLECSSKEYVDNTCYSGVYSVLLYWRLENAIHIVRASLG